MSVPDFDVRLATAADVPAVLAALGDGYGRPFTPDWFQWKHCDSPWGESRCWVAADKEGLLGVVFGLPWRLVDQNGPVACSRLVDGATTVRAQRRGVFRAVVRAELEASAAALPPGLVIATATPEARAAHVKNGAVALEPINSWYRPVRWSRASMNSSLDLLSGWRPPTTDRVSTAWNEQSLRWRLDPCSGSEYQVSALALGRAPHGVVHRTTVRRGFRTLVVTAQWGTDADVAALLRALAWRDKAMVVLAPAGPGAVAPAPRLGRPRGQSLLCVWDRRDAVAAIARNQWAMQGLDLEGVI